MRKITTLCVCLLCIGITTTLKSQTEMTKEQQRSYAIGANMGLGLMRDGLNVDMQAFMDGLRDGLANQNKFTDEQMNVIFGELQQEIMNNRNNQANVEKAKGKQFLEENKNKEGVQVTASGLQYKIVRQGEGPKPTAKSKVTVHYKGTLLDGTVFDSTEQTGQPISFGLDQVIRGWTEGLQLMNAGSKYIFYIPSELAYGDQGAGGVIPGGATLIFEIELLSFE